MIEPTPARKPRKAPQPEALLAAACGIVSREGLAGLTLRPLAEALGVSVTVLSNHYGARADILAAVCHAGCAQDAALLAEWRHTLDAVGALTPAIKAELAEAILDDLSTRQRALSLLYLEMLHACTWDASLRPAFAAWRAQRNQFWSAFAQQAGLAAGLQDSGWWHGFVIAELAYGVALSEVPAYRMLRRLCLRRLFAGGVAAANDGGDAVLFDVLVAQMRFDIGAARDAAGRTPDWALQAARACGIWLAAQGVNGLTHRAIAAHIGIPHTTLSYRYPTQYDLVVAGVESIVAHIYSAVDSGSLDALQRLRTEGDGKKLDLARASVAVAIAAARLPELAPYTLKMRGRRGNNLVRIFQKYVPDAQGVDALCAQVISMGLTGLTNTQPPGEESEQAIASAYAAAVRWLHQSHSA